MSKPKNKYRVVESDGTYTFISSSRAKHCVDKGYADLVRPLVIKFKPYVEPTKPIAWGAQLTVIPGSDSDSGQSGFLAYPQPCGLSTGPKFPGLYRDGAGL